MYLNNNIIKRILSSIVIGTIFIGSILFLEVFFFFLCFILTVLMIYEWNKINNNNITHLIFGFLVILVSISSIINMYMMENGKLITLLYFLLIWTVDVFALIGGKLIQGPKLAPTISPQKTWSGLFIGVTSSMCVVFLLEQFAPLYEIIFNIFTNLELYLLVFTTAIFAQISDLFESYFKRINNLKDSGKIIPGHGGILDRFDSILFSAPIFYAMINLYLHSYR